MKICKNCKHYGGRIFYKVLTRIANGDFLIPYCKHPKIKEYIKCGDPVTGKSESRIYWCDAHREQYGIIHDLWDICGEEGKWYEDKRVTKNK